MISGFDSIKKKVITPVYTAQQTTPAARATLPQHASRWGVQLWRPVSEVTIYCLHSGDLVYSKTLGCGYVEKVNIITRTAQVRFRGAPFATEVNADDLDVRLNDESTHTGRAW
jgi:hypothetical protein